MNVDVILITFISILYFPNCYECVDEFNLDGLDTEQFDYSRDPLSIERHKKEIERINRLKHFNKAQELPKITSSYVKRLAIYSLSILFFAQWAYKGYRENRKIAKEWYESLTPLLMLCIPMPKNEITPIKTLGYHHFKLDSKGIKNYVFLYAELTLKMRQCFCLHNIRKFIVPQNDIFNLSIIFNRMDVFGFTIVNKSCSKNFLNEHYETKRAIFRHPKGDITHFLETYTNSTSTFDVSFPYALKLAIHDHAQYIRFIHFSDIITAHSKPITDKDTVPDDTFKGIKMSFILPTKCRQEKLVTMMIDIIKFCSSISLDDNLRRQINDQRAEYIKELETAHDVLLKQEFEESKNKAKSKAKEESDDESDEDTPTSDGKVKNKNKARFRIIGS